jgi:eukaryotic-like serine/threonine-protein kinase
LPASGLPHRIAQFGVFVADLELGELRREGRPVPVQDHQLLVLAALLENPGAEVSRQELRRRLWPDQEFLDFENGINTAVGRLRQALGDSAENPRFIVTRRGHGYRFIAPVSWSTSEGSEDPAATVAVPLATAAPHQTSHLSKKSMTYGLLLGAAILGTLGLGIVWFWNSRRIARVESPPASLLDTADPILVHAPTGEALTGSFALSPSGTRLALVTSGATSEDSRLWLRSLDDMVTRPLPGTEGAAMPFWSPDERSLGFFAQGKLKTIDLRSERVAIVADAIRARGGTWGTSDVILFAKDTNSPILSVPARGGAVTQVTDLGGAPSHRFPFFLPDGQHFLYLVLREDRDQSEIWWARLGSPEGRRLFAANSQAAYSAQGYVLFARGSALLAQAFDRTRLEPIGKPFVLSENVGVYGEEGPTGLGAFSVSSADVVAVGDLPRRPLSLMWFDRRGHRLGAVGPPVDYSALDLSPDGTRAVVVRFDPRKRSSDLSVIDLQSGLLTQITDDPWPDSNGVWDPTSKRLAFGSLRNSLWRGFIRDPSRESDEQSLPDGYLPESWFPDGNSLLCSTVATPSALWKVPIGVEPATPLVFGLGFTQGSVSRDGSWLAYSSDHDGRRKIFALALRSALPSQPIVLGPGDAPRWRRDSRELFFLAGRTLMSVPVSVGSVPSFGRPQPLFDVSLPARDSLADFRVSFGVSADGSKFLFPISPTTEPQFAIQIVRHWNAVQRP